MKIYATFLAFVIYVLSSSSLWAQTTSTPSDDSRSKTFVVEYYYKVKWGDGKEFLRLFIKNHLPLLREQEKLGRIKSIQLQQPFYHSTEEGRWDFRVTVEWKNALIAHDDFDGREIIKKLYTDEAAWRAEEHKRFGLLLSHWDVVVEGVKVP